MSIEPKEMYLRGHKVMLHGERCIKPWLVMVTCFKPKIICPKPYNVRSLWICPDPNNTNVMFKWLKMYDKGLIEEVAYRFVTIDFFTDERNWREG
jgi:hypothetical protein